MLTTLPIKTHHGHALVCARMVRRLHAECTRACSSRRLPSNRAPNHLLEELDRDAAAGGVSEGLLGLAVEFVASETASVGQYVWETVRAQACQWALTQKRTLRAGSRSQRTSGW